jgi:hypothetical protein
MAARLGEDVTRGYCIAFPKRITTTVTATGDKKCNNKNANLNIAPKITKAHPEGSFSCPALAYPAGLRNSSPIARQTSPARQQPS